MTQWEKPRVGTAVVLIRNDLKLYIKAYISQAPDIPWLYKRKKSKKMLQPTERKPSGFLPYDFLLEPLCCEVGVDRKCLARFGRDPRKSTTNVDSGYFPNKDSWHLAFGEGIRRQLQFLEGKLAFYPMMICVSLRLPERSRQDRPSTKYRFCKRYLNNNHNRPMFISLSHFIPLQWWRWWWWGWGWWCWWRWVWVLNYSYKWYTRVRYIPIHFGAKQPSLWANKIKIVWETSGITQMIWPNGSLWSMTLPVAWPLPLAKTSLLWRCSGSQPHWLPQPQKPPWHL